ncbi:MAG: hypothetical protein ACFFDW_11840, partial [Candidatus Thorarchaeota archaeon]
MSDYTNISKVKLNIDNIKSGILFIVHTSLEMKFKDEAKKLIADFLSEYNKLIEENSEEDFCDYLKLLRMIKEFKPALSTAIKSGSEFDTICEVVSTSFDVYLASAKRQMADLVPTVGAGPILPGSNKESDIKYYCSVCKQYFEIPEDEKERILNNDEE